MRLVPTTAAACLAAACAPSFAGDYSPPEGGWYQLLTPDTFEEVCSTSTAPCFVPPGEYVQIDFGTTPETRERIVVPETGSVGADPTNPLGLVFVEQACTIGDNFIGGDVERCEVSCPAGSAVVGVTTCRAYWVDRSGPGGGLVRGVPTWFERIDAATVDCRAMEGSLIGADPRDDTVEVGVSCAPYSR